MRGRAIYLVAGFLSSSLLIYLQAVRNQVYDAKLTAWVSTSGFASFWKDGIPDSHLQDHPDDATVRDNLYDVQNATLGAQEVFLITLPTRRDKRDAFAMQALVSNFTYTPTDGVMGDQVPKKALPYTMKLGDAEIGCWRAHMNVFQEIIERKIASAIVFEDDADWDVAIKSQLVQLAKGTRFVTGLDPNSTLIPHSPYGVDWDVLWLGHCNTIDSLEDNRRFVIPHDPTVLPVRGRKEFHRPEMRFWDKEGSDYKTRIVYRALDSSCTAAYAISFRGAQKALYHLSMSPNNQPIDNGIGQMCGYAAKDFRCFASNPTLVGISKPAGSTDRGSDVGHAPAQAVDVPFVQVERLMYSTRINLLNLLAGNTGMLTSQWPDHSPHMDLVNISAAVGYPYVISPAERKEQVLWYEQEEAA